MSLDTPDSVIETTQAPRLSRSRLVPWLALGIAAIVTTAGIAFLAFELRNLERTRLAEAELYAKVIETNTTRDLQAAASMLSGLADRLGVQGAAVETIRPLLNEALRDQPLLRSLAVLDDQGRVLASSQPGAEGKTVPWSALGGVPRQTGRVVLGPLLPVRDLVELAGNAAGGGVTSPVTAWPMIVSQTPVEGAQRLLVALVNPDHFATQNDRLLDDVDWQSALTGFTGVLLAASPQVQRAPGGAALDVPAFRDHLPAREHGRYIGAGIDGQQVVTAFRASRQWPVVVVVEQQYRHVRGEFLRLASATAAGLVLIWSLLALVAAALRRAALRQEKVDQDLARRDAAMRASEARKQAILQSSLDAIVTVDAEGRIIDFNPAAERMFGHPAESTLGQPMHELMVPHPHRQAHQAGMARYRQTRQQRVLNRRIEVEGLRADGSVFPVELTIVPVQTAEGEVFTATLRDITERLRVERELRASEERLRVTFEQAAVGMLRQGEDRSVLEVNPALCEMLGAAREQLLDQRFADRIHPDDVDEGIRGMRQLFAGELKSFQQEKRYRRNDGSYVWVRLSASVGRGADGQAPYMICVVENIHARKAAEQERNELLARVSAALTGLQRQRTALDQHAIVSIADARGRITYTNSKLSQVSGYSASELLGAPHGLMREQQPGVVQQPLVWRGQKAVPVGREVLDCIETGQVWEGELLHMKKNGSSFWAASTVVPMRDSRGALEEVFFIQTDVTERIHAEQAVAEARAAELQMGSRIQQALLVTPPDQRLPRTWISSFAQPSKGIDGDFVEVVTVGAHCVDIVLGDVMGKGVSAALIGAATKMQLGHCIAELMARGEGAPAQPPPRDIVAALHRAMAPSLLSLEAFVTLVYLRIDTQADTITWVGCGHEETLVIGADGAHALLANQHPPIGVIDELHYEQDTRALRQGDAVFVLSDGITDALRPDGQRVGREAVVEKVQALLGRHDTPAAVLHVLKRDLLGADVRVTDDMTMLLAVRTGDTAQHSRRELRWSAHDIGHVRGLVAARATAAGLDETDAGLYTVACVEAFTNIVRHARGQPAEAPIEMVVSVARGAIGTEFIYLGDAFRPPEPAAETSFDDYPEGGFGATIMERAADLVEYERVDGVNRVRLIRQC